LRRDIGTLELGVVKTKINPSVVTSIISISLVVLKGRVDSQGDLMDSELLPE